MEMENFHAHMESSSAAATAFNFILLPNQALNFGASRPQVLQQPTVQQLKHAGSQSPLQGGSPPLKPAKKLRTEDNTIQRCKRRLDFARFGLDLHRPKVATVTRRNERERNRVKTINDTFDVLRRHLPEEQQQQLQEQACRAKSKKMSKVDTLRRAIYYIQDLQELLQDHDAVQAAFPSGHIPSDLTAVPQTAWAPSPGHDSVDTAPSPGSTYSDPPLSPEEEDLMDFTRWFQ